jgi:hypothetical protein
MTTVIKVYGAAGRKAEWQKGTKAEAAGRKAEGRRQMTDGNGPVVVPLLPSARRLFTQYTNYIYQNTY